MSSLSLVARAIIGVAIVTLVSIGLSALTFSFTFLTEFSAAVSLINRSLWSLNPFLHIPIFIFFFKTFILFEMSAFVLRSLISIYDLIMGQ